MKANTYGRIKSQTRPSVRKAQRAMRAQENATRQEHRRHTLALAKPAPDSDVARHKWVLNRMTARQRVVWARAGRPKGDALEAFLRIVMWAHLRPKGMDIEAFLYAVETGA